MEMLEQVSNFDQNITFITGFAGSGKSTRLVQDCTPDTLVLTPTHDAAKVLKGKGIKNVYTIHSVLKLVPTLNENFRKGQRLQKLTKIGDTDLKDIKRVAVDEFSMINTSIMDLLLEVLPAECEVLVYGDPYQLPPVSGELIDPLDYADEVIELTTQHRADAPEVVETFMRFMNYIKDGSEMNLKLNDKIKKGDLKDFNPDTDRILAYTNNKVIELNSKVANILNLTMDISEGETILMNNMFATLLETDYNQTIYPNCVSKGKLMEDDTLQLAIQKTENEIAKFGTDLSEFDVMTIDIDGNKYNIKYDLEHHKTSKFLEAQVHSTQHQVIVANGLDKDVHIPTFCRDNRNAPGVKERGLAWSNYLKHKNLVWDVRRPFATTVHKSQGKEFSTVYIAQNDIKKSIVNGYYLQYARLMYVALSRAINRVVIID